MGGARPAGPVPSARIGFRHNIERGCFHGFAHPPPPAEPDRATASIPAPGLAENRNMLIFVFTDSHTSLPSLHLPSQTCPHPPEAGTTVRNVGFCAALV